MNFLDGVLIASCFWFFACLACLIRGVSYGWNDFDIPRNNWSDGWDDGYKCGVVNGMPKWISVEDALPDECSNDKYIVLFEDGGCCGAEFNSCAEDGIGFGGWHDYYDPNTLGFVDSEWECFQGVTHWMPMPEQTEEKT